MKEKKEIPCIFYIYLHSKIVEHTKDNLESVRNIKRYLGHWRIPYKIRMLMIKELEYLGLIKRINRQKVKLYNSNFEINKCNKYYKTLNIF